MRRRDPLNQVIGAHVASVLVGLKASKQGTAHKSGIAPTTFRRCLTGERAFLVVELWRVSQALGIKPSALFPPDEIMRAEQARIRAEEEAMWDAIDEDEVTE